MERRVKAGEIPGDEGKSGLAKATRGAVYVEFLIAFLPMFCFFLCLVQFCFLEIGSIMVKHAAEMTARAAIVVIHDDPKYYGSQPGQVSGKRKQDIQAAADAILAPLRGDQQVSIDMKGSYGRDELVEVKLTYQFTCKVPFGKFVLCDGVSEAVDWNNTHHEHRTLTGKAALPNQGADYIY